MHLDDANNRLAFDEAAQVLLAELYKNSFLAHGLVKEGRRHSTGVGNFDQLTAPRLWRIDHFLPS